MAGKAQIMTRLVRWLLLGLVTALGALAGLGYVLLSHPVYTAKAYVLVVAQNPGDSTSAVSYAQAYARIAGQGEALNAAATASNGAASVSELRSQVRASTSPDAPVIEVTGSAGSARHAADLANLVAIGLVSTANDHSADTRMRLTVLSAAIPPADPASPRPALDIAVGAAMGLLLGGLALLAGPGRGGADTGRVRRTTVNRTEPAEGAAVPEMWRWTGRAPVTVAPAAAVLNRPEKAGPNDHDARTVIDDRIRDDNTAKRDGSR